MEEQLHSILGMEQRNHIGWIERRVAWKDVDRSRQRGSVSLMQTRGALCGRQHEAPDLFMPKQWFVQVDMASAAHDDIQRMKRSLADVLAKCVKLLLECWVHAVRGPQMPGGVPKRVLSEHDRVGIGA